MTKRGLPEGFSLKLPKASDIGVGAVDLPEDEFDSPKLEVVPKPPPPAPPRKEERIRTQPVEEPFEEPLVIQRRRPAVQPTVQTGSGRGKEYSRMYLNIPQNVQDRFKEVVDEMATYSSNKQLYPKDVAHGLFTALLDAADHIDVSRLPQRGAWGSATAKAFPVGMQRVVERAIAISYLRKHPELVEDLR